MGLEHMDTFSAHNVVEALMRLRQVRDGDGMNRDTLEGREKVLGQEHLDTLNSRVNQAVSEANQGRQKGAEELDVQLPETRKRLLEA
jgi:hypothetical protein